jgi:ATP-dependent helicase/nuclease subunit A
VPPRASWYTAVDASLDGLGSDWQEDPLWGKARCFGVPGRETKAAARAGAPDLALPSWIGAPAPQEARPPRPLAPSSLGEDDVADPPPSPALREVARRGKLLHQLFERLPDVPPAERVARAQNWLEHSASVEDQALRRALIEDVCRIIADPAYAELFGTHALAEAPIAAVVGEGVVVSGTVDRLLIGEDRIVLADFKTGRKVPASPEDIPVPHLRQMAAYSEALAVIFPGLRIEAKLLYTSGPVLHDLTPALLARYRPVLETAAAAP